MVFTLETWYVILEAQQHCASQIDSLTPVDLKVFLKKKVSDLVPGSRVDQFRACVSDRTGRLFPVNLPSSLTPDFESLNDALMIRTRCRCTRELYFGVAVQQHPEFGDLLFATFLQREIQQCFPAQEDRDALHQALLAHDRFYVKDPAAQNKFRLLFAGPALAVDAFIRDVHAC